MNFHRRITPLETLLKDFSSKTPIKKLGLIVSAGALTVTLGIILIALPGSLVASAVIIKKMVSEKDAKTLE